MTKTSLLCLALLGCAVSSPPPSTPLMVYPNEYIVENSTMIPSRIGVKSLSISFSLLNLKSLPTSSQPVQYDPEKDACLTDPVLKRKSCSPNYLVRTEMLPNDPLYGRQWALGRIDARKAWNKSSGTGILIGVLDTGIAQHPDIKAPQCFNAITNTPGNCEDGNGHGTHVAGTIGASSRNHVGVAGLSYNSELLVLKFLNDSGTGSLFHAIRGIDYAAAKGVKVINGSFGGGGYSEPFFQAIKRHPNILFVFAAGNEGVNNATYPHYPSDYKLPNVINVASINKYGHLSPFSNYGRDAVDIAAPGQEILSLGKSSDYISLSGTSMAAPHVTGAVALRLAAFPSETILDAKKALLKSAKRTPSLKNKLRTGELSAADALNFN